MPMKHAGLAKLVEECGELTQIAAKKIAFFETDEHPDGDGSMKKRLEDEMADVLAACAFVITKLDLNLTAIVDRKFTKLERFHKWNATP